MATASNLEYALAINGGAPVRNAPFPPWPVLEEEEIEAATAVLRSGRLNYWTGNEGRAFEREFAEFTGRKYAIALANGTVALELALYCLGIGSGDEVVVPSRTFIASASCAVMRGATRFVADVDRDSSNVTAETIERVLTSRTKAIVVVHLAGWPCEMDPYSRVGPQPRHCSHRRLRAGSWGTLPRSARRFLWGRGCVLLLPGQEHDNRRRRGDAPDERLKNVGTGLEFQGSRQELRSGV